MKPKVLAIVGPTAVGKTTLSLRLAQQYHGELISGDSMQVYRGLNIGTAKATTAEQLQVPHHLLDIRTVNNRYSAYDFQQDAKRLINEINSRGKLPIIVGGTGFYLAGLLKNLPLGGHDELKNLQIRHELEVELATIGPQALWQQLLLIDPVAANKIPVNNSRRTVRALEVIRATGGKFSNQPDPIPIFDSYVLGLNCQREQLYQRINQRVELMIGQGLEQEAYWLFQQVESQAQPAKGIGYREWWPYFEGKITLAQVINAIQRDSRHYAKRQLTYFRNQFDTQWYDLVANEQINQLNIKTDLNKWLNLK